MNEHTRHVKSLAVANFFLDEARKLPRKLFLQDLHNLIYLANGWHMVHRNGSPLLSLAIHASSRGLEVEPIRDQFIAYAHTHIDRNAMTFWVYEKGPATFRFGQILETPRFDPRQIGEDQQALRLLVRVWDRYKFLSDGQLQNACTGSMSPWRRLQDAFCGKLPANAIIPDEWIREHFERLNQEAPLNKEPS